LVGFTTNVVGVKFNVGRRVNRKQVPDFFNLKKVSSYKVQVYYITQ